jgi:ribosomal protein S18 acetylase RimI-like enzyme
VTMGGMREHGLKSEAVIELRPAEVPDLAALARLLVISFELYPAGQRWLIPLMAIGIQFDLQQRLLAQRYVCFVATVNAQMVGTIELSYRQPWPWQLGRSPYAYIANLAVQPQYRQQGIARQMITRSEAMAREWGERDVYLHVMEDNAAARQLYLQAGYYIDQVEYSWNAWFGQPQRLFLHKRLTD